MRLLWLLIGVVVAVSVYLFFPDLFSTIVSLVQRLFDWIMGFAKGV